MITRTATPTEIIEKHTNYIELGWKVSYRHFTKEIFNPNSKTGVSHRDHSRSTLRVIDGVPHVKYRGELVEVTGDHVTLDNGKWFVGDLRIKDQYLP